MAATATEQPVLDRLTVLASGGEHRGVAWTAGQRGEQSVARAADLRKIRPAGGRETMRAALALKEGENRYNIRSTADFLKRFGAGKEDPARMTPSEKASYQKAREVLQKDAKIALFLELKTLSDTEQTAFLKDADIRAAIGEKPTGALTYDDIRKAALDSIARDSSFMALFPELNAHTPALTDDNKRDFIEKTLMPAEDGRLASRLGTRMQEAYKQSLKLTDVVTDEDRAKYRQQENEGRLTLDQKAQQISDYLDEKGIYTKSGGRFKSEDIVKWITQSPSSPDGAINTVLEKALGCSHQEFSEMIQFKDAEVKMPIFETSFKTKHAAGPYATTPFDLGAFLTGNPTDPDVIIYKQHQAAYTKGLPQYGAAAGGAPAGANRPLYEKFYTTFSPLVNEPSLVDLSKAAKEAQIKMETAGIKMKGLPVITVDEEKAHLTRTLEEEDLCGVLDGILGQSIADVLEERYDVMEERMGRLTTEDQKKAEQNIQKMVLELKKKMHDNWIEIDATTHKKKAKKDNIKRDVTHLSFTYDKDMALKQLIARDLFGLSQSQCEKLNVIDGTQTGAAAGAAPLLTETQLKQLNEVSKLAGQEYRDKLFADLFAARTIGDRSWNFGFGLEVAKGTLAFKRGEWEQMLKLYEPEITKGLEENHEAKAAIANLEAQGVKLDHKMKWVWYILAVLLGLGGGSIGGAVGLPAVNALKGMGTAFIGHGTSRVVGEVAGAAAAGIGAKKVIDHFNE